MPAALAGDHHGVHQARVASRRLREAVPILSTGVGGRDPRKAERKIRRLTRALGTVRELDVTLQLLDELAREQRVPRTSVEEVRGHVLAERKRNRDQMLKAIALVNTAKLERRLESVRDALERDEQERWRGALASRLLRQSRKLSKAIADAGQLYAPDKLHRVRIASKKLRYVLELAADSGTRAAAPLVRTMKRMQDLLGLLHDLQVLQGHVAAVQAQAATGTGSSPRGLDLLARHLEEQCRHLHGRYVASTPVLRALCDGVAADVVPQLARGGTARASRSRAGRRRPLKMTLPRATTAGVAKGTRRS